MDDPAMQATTCVIGALSAFLVSRCQRGRECRICVFSRDLRVESCCFRAFASLNLRALDCVCACVLPGDYFLMV